MRGRWIHSSWAMAVMFLLTLGLAAFAVKTSQDDAASARALAAKARTVTLGNRAILRELERTRERAVRDGCVGDVAQDDVLRAVLRASLAARRRLGPRDRSGGLTYDEAVGLARRLMRPLGGLEPLKQKSIRERCDMRVERGTPGGLRVAPAP